MQILKNSNNINKYIEKKSYSQPQLKEIGRVNKATKGGGSSFTLDQLFPIPDVS